MQLLVRVVAALAAALAPQQQQQQQQKGQGQQVVGAGGGARLVPVAAAEALPAGRVVTANDFLFERRLESINMLQLLAWAREVKLLQKVRGRRFPSGFLACGWLPRAAAGCEAAQVEVEASRKHGPMGVAKARCRMTKLLWKVSASPVSGSLASDTLGALGCADQESTD